VKLPRGVHRVGAVLGITPERVKTAEACSITGLPPRVVQRMAIAGKIPGAVKLGGSYTFDVAKLRAWVADEEKRQCETRKTIADARPRPTPNGAATRFGAPSSTREDSGSGAYERAMSALRDYASRKTSRS
jgi:Helix-turn-helix domain